MPSKGGLDTGVGMEPDEGAGQHLLAAALGASDDDVLRALGAGWRPADVADDTGWAQWFVSGEPAQVLVGVRGPTLVVARPDPRWDGGADPVTHAVEDREFATEDLVYQAELVAEEVERLARRRRQSFRWCRTCRTLNPPEHMHGRTECQDCAGRYRRVVY